MSSLKDKITAKDLDDSKGKARLTMYLDIDVLNTIRTEAKCLKIGYQTYINQILREVFVNQEIENKSTTKYLLKEINKIKTELRKIKTKK